MQTAICPPCGAIRVIFAYNERAARQRAPPSPSSPLPSGSPRPKGEIATENRSYALYSSLPPTLCPHARAELDSNALRRNYRLLSKAILRGGGHPRLMAVVKAEAYGHGLSFVMRTLLPMGCDFFAVANLSEALAARAVSRELGRGADILILGYTPPEEAATLAREDLIQTLLSKEYADALADAADASGVQVRVHAALDTGMNRIGYPAHSDEEISSAADAILRVWRRGSLLPEGVFTHLSHADMEGDLARTQTERQVARFEAVRDRLTGVGLTPLFSHICNSAAAISGTAPLLDGVRIGILLYGGGAFDPQVLPLSPVMRFSGTVTHLHDLLPGEGVSYGGDFVADTPRRIATVSVGYGDGLPRASTGGTVTLYAGGEIYRVPIVGRVCMDQCMLDVTGLPASVGDAVVFFGETPGDAAMLARVAGTLDYELFCSLSARVPRMLREDRS